MKNKLLRKLFALTLTLVFVFVFTSCHGAVDTQESTNAITSTQGETDKESSPAPVTDTQVSNSQEQNSNTSDDIVSQSTSSIKPSTNGSQISRDKALSIALKDAGLKKSLVYDLEVELDNDKGVLHYDISFEYQNKDYDYEINAKTGKIISVEKPNATASAVKVSKATAKSTALKHAGVKSADISRYQIELEKDDGVWKYELSFNVGYTEYEYTINAENGKILHSEKEIDD